MADILAKAQNLDVDAWLRGLFSAGISGGSSAVVGGVTLSGIDPANYNFYKSKFYVVVGILFATNAIVSIAKFLTNQPLPSMKQVEKTIQTITPATADSPKIVETVKTIITEPKDKPNA